MFVYRWLYFHASPGLPWCDYEVMVVLPYGTERKHKMQRERERETHTHTQRPFHQRLKNQNMADEGSLCKITACVHPEYICPGDWLFGFFVKRHCSESLKLNKHTVCTL